LPRFSGLTQNSISPSVEANFHLALESKFITHLHFIGSIAIGVSDRNFTELHLTKGVSFVPYARPGVDLAKAIDKIAD
jgi:rhamnose utilization protein RhaD (predicted bifunctional aldolase and dehydrogenase)